MKKALFIVALLISTASLTKAQGGGQGRMGGTPEERLKRSLAALEPLKLTEDQTKKATVIFTAQAKTRDSLMTAANGDYASMREKMAPLQADADKKILAILDDTQKKAYEEIIKNRPQRGQGGGGGGQRPPQSNN